MLPSNPMAQRQQDFNVFISSAEQRFQKLAHKLMLAYNISIKYFVGGGTYAFPHTLPLGYILPGVEFHYLAHDHGAGQEAHMGFPELQWYMAAVIVLVIALLPATTAITALSPAFSQARK